ncbi:MAG: hypothetical protein FWF10_07425 [Clostridiales bacterium]|nr:hypothetical protein [Clostridiales bacterium]
MKFTQKNYYMVSLYSITHMLIDFACAFLMFRRIAATPDWQFSILLYNFCAFALQMPIGLVADRLNRNALLAGLGCALVALAYGLWALPLAAVCALGIGNALFHVGGGLDVLNISEKKSSALGVFVSPGAFGIFFGTMLGRGGAIVEWPLLLALSVFAGLIFTLRPMQKEAYKGNAPLSLEGAARLLPSAFCLFLVVCLRSYAGLALQFPWKGTGQWGVALVTAVVLGKALGGFAADRFGAKLVSCISLGVAAILFLFPQVPILGVLSVLLFNMTMPITLWAMAKSFPGAKGFSFGLLTFALFLGFLPVYFGVQASAAWIFTLLAALSLVLLWAGLRKAKT